MSADPGQVIAQELGAVGIKASIVNEDFGTWVDQTESGNAPALYYIATSRGAYHEHQSPLRDITSGDNWYWYAHEGYDRATGVGVPDVANLLEALREIRY